MTIDWWGLGLQAVNFLILAWLLARVFWRPVAGAIAKRQEATQATAGRRQRRPRRRPMRCWPRSTEARAGIAAERETLLAAARATADAATKATLDDAQKKAEALVATARATIERDTAAARKAKRGTSFRPLGGHRRQALGPAEHAHGSGSVS